MLLGVRSLGVQHPCTRNQGGGSGSSRRRRVVQAGPGPGAAAGGGGWSRQGQGQGQEQGRGGGRADLVSLFQLVHMPSTLQHDACHPLFHMVLIMREPHHAQEQSLASLTTQSPEREGPHPADKAGHTPVPYPATAMPSAGGPPRYSHTRPTLLQPCPQPGALSPLPCYSCWGPTLLQPHLQGAQPACKCAVAPARCTQKKTCT